VSIRSNVTVRLAAQGGGYIRTVHKSVPARTRGTRAHRRDCTVMRSLSGTDRPVLGDDGQEHHALVNDFVVFEIVQQRTRHALIADGHINGSPAHARNPVR
jgi:hypothetical protein